MPSYEHKKLVAQIFRVDQVPDDPSEFSKWIEAGQHLDLLLTDSAGDEIIFYGSGAFMFTYSMVVPNAALSPLDKDDLLLWSGNPYTSIASYVYGGGKEGMWIENNNSNHGSKTLRKGKDLIFGREFEGWTGKGRTYFEVNQEYSHLADIHWRPEHSAYCRFDGNGDLEEVVSITSRDSDNVAAITFRWDQLEKYLAVSDTSLVRMFDFTLLRRGDFSGWGDGPEEYFDASPSLFYRRKINGNAAFTRGVQILRPRRPAKEVIDDIKNSWRGERGEKSYVEFVAYDFRNKRITKISTAPSATTNYFETNNNLPFELSPAFFRPEVLSKYKTDREKYTVSSRNVECRAAWVLKGYDVNDAGQVHAYICDLAKLPYSEQLHWLAFNEQPKATISARALENDFKGQFVTFQHPRDAIMSIARRWNDDDVGWWKLRDENLLDHANPPLTSSRDEWATAFMELSQLIVEGFELKAIRKMLDATAIAYNSNDQSILLLEKLIAHTMGANAQSLTGIREAQKVRSKIKGHAGSSEGKLVVEAAIEQHGSFPAHFKNVCESIEAELGTIETTCNRY